MVMDFGNSGPRLAVHRFRRIGAICNGVKRRKPHSDLQPRRIRTNTRYHFPQKAGSIFKAPSVLSLSCVRAQKFVTQIAVAMLDVDKIESQTLGEFRCPMKIRNDRFYLGVRQKWVIAGESEPLIQNRMMIQNARFGFCVTIRAAVPPRMRQLQPNDQPILRTSGAAVFLNQYPSQLRQSFLRMNCKHQLIRIRAPFVGNRNGLSSPNEFCAASSEFSPSLLGVLARIPIPLPIPSFHWLNGNPVADPDASAVER